MSFRLIKEVEATWIVIYLLQKGRWGARGRIFRTRFVVDSGRRRPLSIRSSSCRVALRVHFVPGFCAKREKCDKVASDIKKHFPKTSISLHKNGVEHLFLIIWKSLLCIFNDMLRFWMSSLSLNFPIIVVTTSQLQSKPRYFHSIDETNVTAFQVRIETRIWNKHFPGHLLSRARCSNRRATSNLTFWTLSIIRVYIQQYLTHELLLQYFINKMNTKTFRNLI